MGTLRILDTERIGLGARALSQTAESLIVIARQHLKADAKGSVDLNLQEDSPGADKELTCLAAPAGNFILMLRLYWPDEHELSILDGTWVIPPVKRVA